MYIKYSCIYIHVCVSHVLHVLLFNLYFTHTHTHTHTLTISPHTQHPFSLSHTHTHPLSLSLSNQAMIASSKSSTVKTDYNDESARTRLFVVCPKDFTEDDLKQKFEQFGDYDYCNIIRDKQTGESKGFGYVKFLKASTAAVAMENCDKSLKAILAEPKSAKFAREAAQAAMGRGGGGGGGGGVDQRYGSRDGGGQSLGSVSPTHNPMDLFTGSQSYLYQTYETPGIGNRLFVLVNPTITQEQLMRLFDLIPGLEMCEVKRNHLTGESRGFAYITYGSIQAAMYAKEKLNGFEYPLGHKLIVKWAEDPIPQRYPPSPTAEPMYASSSFHSAPHSPIHRSPIIHSPARSLSPMRPMPMPRHRRHSITEFDGRVFFICTPQPPAEHILRDIFGRFGILTDLWVVRGKNYGYAKFTHRGSAEAAITALHGMEVFGVKLKVMLADPPPDDTSKNKRPRM